MATVVRIFIAHVDPWVNISFKTDGSLSPSKEKSYKDLISHLFDSYTDLKFREGCVDTSFRAPWSGAQKGMLLLYEKFEKIDKIECGIIAIPNLSPFQFTSPADIPQILSHLKQQVELIEKIGQMQLSPHELQILPLINQITDNTKEQNIQEQEEFKIEDNWDSVNAARAKGIPMDEIARKLGVKESTKEEIEDFWKKYHDFYSSEEVRKADDEYQREWGIKPPLTTKKVENLTEEIKGTLEGGTNFDIESFFINPADLVWVNSK